MQKTSSPFASVPLPLFSLPVAPIDFLLSLAFLFNIKSSFECWGEPDDVEDEEEEDGDDDEGFLFLKFSLLLNKISIFLLLKLYKVCFDFVYVYWTFFCFI